MALDLRESSENTKAAIPFETKHFESLPSHAGLLDVVGYLLLDVT
jgi:hypothetical protein